MRPAPRAAGLAAALAVVLAAYALVFGGALWNRSGEPLADLRLTERELPLPPFLDRDETLVSLDLALTHQSPFWERQLRGFRPGAGSPPIPWLDRDKLAELGFDVAADPPDAEAEERHSRAVPRVVYAALELDGACWTAWIEDKEREAATSEVDREILDLAPSLRSRLCAVDAGKDAGTMQRKYPDPHRYAIVRALVRPSVTRDDAGSPRLAGTLLLENATVFLPPSARSAIVPFLPTMTADEFAERRARGTLPPPVAREPRLAFDVAFGRRHEPWIRGHTSR